MWLSCYTQEEIAEAVGVSQAEIAAETKELSEIEMLPKVIKLAALYQDKFEPELLTEELSASQQFL